MSPTQFRAMVQDTDLGQLLRVDQVEAAAFRLVVASEDGRVRNELKKLRRERYSARSDEVISRMYRLLMPGPSKEVK